MLTGRLQRLLAGGAKSNYLPTINLWVLCLLATECPRAFLSLALARLAKKRPRVCWIDGLVVFLLFFFYFSQLLGHMLKLKPTNQLVASV